MNEMFMPLISIIIPVYNGSNYLAEAIDSALSQTYKNIEIIVVNDGSKDDGATEKIALSYGKKIRYFSKENGGVSSALNLGIANMKGEYFSWLSHDDKYEPKKIENQVEVLNNFGNDKSLIICSVCQIDKNSKRLTQKKSFFKNELIQFKRKEVLTRLFKKGTLNGCCFLIPKSVFEECGVFDEALRYSQDSFMWIKIFLKDYNLIYSDFCGVLSRVHDGQLTQRGIDIFHKDCVTMSEYLIPELLKISKKTDKIFYYYAIYNARYNNPLVWKRCLREGKDNISFIQSVKIRIMGIYGKIRPFIRKVYLRLFKKVKTK